MVLSCFLHESSKQLLNIFVKIITILLFKISSFTDFLNIQQKLDEETNLLNLDLPLLVFLFSLFNFFLGIVLKSVLLKMCFP